MANYTVTTYQVVDHDIAVIMAAFETKLETLDSTSNPIRMITIKPMPDGKYVGTIIYD